MAAKPRPRDEAEPSADSVDAQLRAWFDGLLAQPVPEALLRHMDELSSGETDQTSPA